MGVSIIEDTNGKQILDANSLNFSFSVLPDLNIQSPEISFHSGASPDMQCIQVSVVDDGILEDEETHCISLNGSYPVVIGSPSMTCISITDTNSKYNMEYIYAGSLVNLCAYFNPSNMHHCST